MEQILSGERGGWCQWEWGGGRERVWEGKYSANTVYVNDKVIAFETIPGIERRRDRGKRWRGEFKYDIFDIV
jgi:hypothetical protein